VSRGAGLRRRRGIFVVSFALCTAGVIATVVMQGRSLTVERSHAQGIARAVANEVDGTLGTKQLDKPIDPTVETALDARLQHALSGQSILLVRVWTPGGILRHSTVANDHSQPLADVLRTTTKGTGRITSVTDANVMTTYVPLRDGPNGAPFGAVEVQQPYGPVLAAAASPWASVRLLIGGAGVLMLVLLALGMLGEIPVRRNARAGAGFARGARSAEHDAMRENEDEGQERDEPEPFRDPLPTREARTAAMLPLGAPPPDESASEAESNEPPTLSPEAIELERIREELKALNRRTGARITELQDELDRTRTQLQEARKAAVPPPEDPALAERARGLQDQLRAENLRAGTAEARIKGLEAQLKLQESKITELTGSLEELGSDASRAAS
jgi:hypothetical protein